MMASDRPATPPSEPPPPKPTHGTLPRSPFLQGFDRFLAVGLVILAFGLASFAVRQSEFWRHLAAGRLIAAGDYSFGKDPFSFVGGNRVWVNHSWLAEWGAYLLYSKVGERSVVVAKAGAIALLAIVLLCVRRKEESLWPGVLAVGLALLASAPWLAMQPLVLSMVFTGVTTFLLVTSSPSSGRWRLPILIAVTFWLWAGCDQWFLIGPVIVALYLLGLFLQRRDADAPPLFPYVLALVLGVVACTLTPNHVRVWQLPAELVSRDLAQTLGRDPRFAPLFAGLFDKGGLDFTGTAGGNPVNAFAFVFLVLLDAAGFAVNRSRFSLGLMFINLALLALTVMHARALPLFAVAAAPTTMVNLGTALEGARGRTVTTGTLQLLAAGRVAVRMGLFAAGVLALLACYPGWLQPLAEQRRLDWAVKPDRGLSEMATRLQEWRESGRLPADAHGVALSADLGDYCAWFAPAEKTFFDSRIGFHAPEAEAYERMRLALTPVPPLSAPPPEFNFGEYFRTNRLSYLAIVSRDSGDTLISLLGERHRDVSPPEPVWYLWAVAGRSAVLGLARQDAVPPVALAGLRFAPRTLAFGPEVRPFDEPAEMFPPQRRDLAARYLNPPSDPSVDADEAFLLRAPAVIQLQMLQSRHQAVAMARMMMTGVVAARFTLMRNPPSVDRIMEDLQSTALLAVRAARRGVANSPGSAAAALALAQCYGEPGFVGPEDNVRLDVVLANAARYFALGGDTGGTYSPRTREAAELLYRLYQQIGWRDATLDALKVRAANYRRQQPTSEKAKAFEEQLKAIDAEIAGRQADLQQRENLWLNARNNPLQAIPLEQQAMVFGQVSIPITDRGIGRALLARRQGLLHKAIESLKAVDLGPEARINFAEQAAVAMELAELLMISGRLDEAETMLREFEDRRGEDLARPDNGLVRLSFNGKRLSVAWAAGRFREVTEMLKAQVTLLAGEIDLMTRDPRAFVVGALSFGKPQGLVFLEVLFGPRGFNGLLDQHRNQLATLRGALEESQFRLALAYLEQGNNTAAAALFRELVKRSRGPTRNIDIAREYLQMMGAES